MTRVKPLLHRIRIASLIAALALGVFAVAGFQTVGRLMQFARDGENRHEKLLALEHVAAAVSRTEAALRDFLWSGASNDRATFEARAWEERNAVEELGVPPVLPEQDTLERLVNRKTLLEYEAVGARALNARDHVERIQETMRLQKNEEEALGSLLQTVREREQQLWWKAHATPTLHSAELVVLFAGILLFSMVGWVAWIVWRYERERRRVGTLLDQTEAMNRALAGNIADGFITQAEDMTILGMNRAAQEMLGYTEAELIGRSVSELVADYPGREQNRKRVEELVARGEPFRITGVDMVARCKDGRLFPVQVSMNDVRVEGGRRITSLFRDMSKIRQATEAVQASERHLREITDTLPVLIVEVDAERRFRFINRACAEFLGLPAEEAIGRRLPDILGTELHALHDEHVDEALGGATVQYEVTVRNAKGEPGVYEMQLVPRRAPGSEEVIGLYAFATNITELKRIDQMKTEFVSTVSHELRTPLTSIRGSLGLMNAGVAGKLPEHAAHLAGIAQNNCDRLIRLINDILDSEKIESGKLPMRMQTLELAPLVQKALQQNEGFAQQHDVRLCLDAPATPLVVRADADRLLQVVTNLLSNAVKFSAKGAEVTVHLAGTADHVQVEVEDRGPGIPLEFQPRIFQKFSQADSSDTRSKSGTGLGLNISRSLVEKMGGRIGFRSKPGEGTTFHFELPAHDGPIEAAAVVPMAPEWVPRDTRILHVEPDPDIRAIVAKLAGPRASCVAAASLQEARQKLREQRYDLLLLETELGDGSGWDLLTDLGETPATPPVLVFSALDAAPPAGCRVARAMVKSQTSETALVHALRRTLAGALDTVPGLLEA